MEFQIDETQKQIAIFLPMTTPTGKARVKRPIPGQQAEPVATRQKTLEPDDYIEWQIAYETSNPDEPSALAKVQFSKGRETRYGAELTRLLVEARHLGLLSQQDFEGLKQLISEPLINSVEESDRILLRKSSPDTLATRHGFARFVLEVPFYEKRTSAYAIQISISKKQRAVGNQAMVYVCLPVAQCTSRSTQNAFIGRTADAKEKATYCITSQNVSLITDAIVAFAIASQNHRDDFRRIFEKIEALR